MTDALHPDADRRARLLGAPRASRGCTTCTSTSCRPTSSARSGPSSTPPVRRSGRDWPIRYRQSHAERVEILRAFGLRRFSTLPYAHKPGVATYLNGWSSGFAAEVPEVIRSATFYPEPEAASYVAAEIADGVEIFKIHLQVGEFHLDDPLLDEVWGLLEDAGTPVVVHAGSGPVPNEFTGPASMERLLRRFPRLCLVVAHMGAPECEEFLALAETYERVHLDTTMVFTEFFGVDLSAPAGPAPARPPVEGAARLRLPDDPLPVRRAARRAGRHRSGRRLAAGCLLGQRRTPPRSALSRIGGRGVKAPWRLSRIAG